MCMSSFGEVQRDRTTKNLMSRRQLRSWAKLASLRRSWCADIGDASSPFLTSYPRQIDCSHGNSSKQHQRQVDVAGNIALQLELSEDTSSCIMGVMLESNLVEGRQDIPASGPNGLKYGQSVTDACISWETTVPVLDRLRKGVQGRRALVEKLAGRG